MTITATIELKTVCNVSISPEEEDYFTCLCEFECESGDPGDRDTPPTGSTAELIKATCIALDYEIPLEKITNITALEEEAVKHFDERE